MCELSLIRRHIRNTMCHNTQIHFPPLSPSVECCRGPRVRAQVFVVPCQDAPVRMAPMSGAIPRMLLFFPLPVYHPELSAKRGLCQVYAGLQSMTRVPVDMLRTRSTPLMAPILMTT